MHILLAYIYSMTPSVDYVCAVHVMYLHTSLEHITKMFDLINDYEYSYLLPTNSPLA